MSYLGQQLGQGQAERFVYTATGGETSVTTDDAGRGIAYTVGQVDVYLNGAKLINGSDFTATTGTSITGLAALTAADVLEVFALSIFQASDTVSASVGGTFNGNVTVDADLSVTGTTTITTADINGGAIDGTTIGGTTPAAGSFTTLTASGDVNFDSGTLFVDASADAVGIGTTSPAEKLHVSGGTNDRIVVSGSGSSGILFKNTGGTDLFQIIYDDSSTDATFITTSDDLVFRNQGGTQGGSITERMRIDSSGNVLVGTTDNAPGSGDTNVGVAIRGGSDNRSFFSVSSDYVASFNRNTNDGEILQFRRDGSLVGSIGSVAGARLRVDSNSTAGYLGIAGTNRYYWNNTELGVSNDNAYNLGASAARFKDLYLSGGVYLGGTGAANQLDDYEEGTWTPTFEPATGAFGSITYQPTRAGRYVKVGQIVHVSGILYTDAITIGTASGDLRIGGLPFTVSNDPSTEHMHSGVVGRSVDWGTNHPQSLLALRNTTTATMYYWSGSGAAAAAIQASDLATGANDNVIYFSISYRVD